MKRLFPFLAITFEDYVSSSSPKGWECEARSHLGSPLGELCNIGLYMKPSV